MISLAGQQPVLLRPGGIPRPELEALIGPIASAEEVSGKAHPSPGMHPRHYSPRTRLLLVSNGEVPDSGHGTYLQYSNAPRRANATTTQMPLSATDYAAALYDKLHVADEGKFDWIAVDIPPLSPVWEAIHDRLRRAAFSR